MFSSVVRTEMSISLDNPGFLLDVSDQVDVHQPDASTMASGSSSSVHLHRENPLGVPVRGAMAG